MREHVHTVPDEDISGINCRLCGLQFRGPLGQGLGWRLGRRVGQSLDRRHFRFAVTETDKAVGLNVHILGNISYFICQLQ